MKIESPSFKQNDMMPAKFTCLGIDINPELVFAKVPDTAKSLVLIVDDPDAPVGTWLHWTVWNIDPKVTKIEENSVPDGAVEGVTDFGSIGYGGPCPPSGTHRYFFKLFALNTTLELNEGARLSALKSAMEGHVIETAELIGKFKK